MKTLDYLRQFSLGLGVAVLLPMAVYWGFRAIYPPPQVDEVTEEIKKPWQALKDSISELTDKKNNLARKFEPIQQEQMKMIADSLVRQLLEKVQLEGIETKEVELLKHVESLNKELRALQTELAPIDKKHEAENKKLLKAWRIKEKRYTEKQFYILVPLGILFIILGAFLPDPFTGFGLIIGGVISLSINLFSYWTYLGDLAKFIALLASLIMIIAIGYVLHRKTKHL